MDADLERLKRDELQQEAREQSLNMILEEQFIRKENAYGGDE